MADLRDQMLKAGLISPEQAKRAGHQKRQDSKRLSHEEKEKQKQARRDETQRQQQAGIEQDQRQGQARQRSREGQERVKADRQRKQALIERCLREGALPRWEGNRTYYFREGDHVVFLLVNDEAQKQLEAGKAAIVRTEGRARYAVIAAGSARELLEGAPERVIAFHRN